LALRFSLPTARHNDIRRLRTNILQRGDHSMSAGAAAGATAAAAAAERERQRRQEEEEMTPYTSQDLGQDWEFKILRWATGAFKKPEQLRRFLEEEARAGWVLVEKFDDSRLRLKRPAKARDFDGKLDVDPYRTYVGMSPNATALMIIGITLGVMLAAILAIVAIAH
jgi:hypothetical protein